MNAKHSRRWLAIRFPHLPIEALKIENSQEQPVVVVEKKKVVHANALARQAGARIGMDVTTAQLLTSSIAVERQVEKELQALMDLSEQLYQFTPYIERYTSMKMAQLAILLEISTCLKLFSGASAMLHAITNFLTKENHRYCLGLAHSKEAAKFLSFAGYSFSGDESSGQLTEKLNTLPIRLLFDYPRILNSLSKTGFKTFGDLAKQINQKSFSSFRKRHGHEFADLLCDMYDVNQSDLQSSLFEKPREVFKSQEWFEEEIQFEYPVTLVDHLKPAMELLLQKLGDYLRKRQMECQHIEWTISDIYRSKDQVKVNSDTPQSHWELLYDLTVIQFEAKELPFEIDTIKLACLQMLPMKRQSNLLDFDQSRRKRASTQDFATVIAKLKARLGDDAVFKLSYRDSRVPELTNTIIALAEKSNQTLPDVYQKSIYPSWILPTPELMQERNQRLFWHGYVSPLVGPERVIGDWWSTPVARDYYLAQRHDHLRLWIYFDLYEKHWYVHGVFS